MRKFLKVFLVLALVSSIGFGFSLGIKDYYFQVDGFSMFPWRGLSFNKGSCLYGEISTGKLAIGAFQYTNWDGSLDNDELDLTLSYRMNLEKLRLSLLYTEYNLPSIKNGWNYTREIGVSFLVLNHFVMEFYKDLGKYNTIAAEFGVETQFIPGLNASIRGGINQSQWVDEEVKYFIGELHKGFGKHFIVHCGAMYSTYNGTKPFLIASWHL